jgi:hypothetical protein
MIYLRWGSTIGRRPALISCEHLWAQFDWLLLSDGRNFGKTCRSIYDYFIIYHYWNPYDDFSRVDHSDLTCPSRDTCADASEYCNQVGRRQS